MYMIKNFHEELEERSGRKVALKINDNRSTVLSVRWGRDYTKVSLHRMFLQAPRNVIQDLACYIGEENREMSQHIKFFIAENMGKMDYSHVIDPKKLCARGTVYDLNAIFYRINREYFANKLPQLHITWFGKANQRNRSRVTFGLFHSPLKLIKIHRILDHAFVPDYVVDFVVHHEICHYVCPAYLDGNGIQRIHNKEFKKLELKFRYYDLAQRWIKDHREYLFKR